MSYPISHIANIINGVFIRKHDDARIEYLLTDSRKVLFPSTSVFFALQGPARNGHSFLKDLFEQGVRNFIVMENFVDSTGWETCNIVLVEHSLQALQALAAYHRSRFSIPLIGITGSNGKTIVKEWLFHLLENDYQIARSPKSYNSQLGVPLSVWQLSSRHTLALLEAGVSEKGEMQKLESIICPTIGILTNVGQAHSEGFDNFQQKVDEKLILFKHANLLIYCKDQPEIQLGIDKLVAASKPQQIQLFSWSMSETATLTISSITTSSKESIISATYNAKQLSVSIPFTDAASIENAIHCWCLLLYMKIDSVLIAKRMEQLQQLAMRLELKKAINSCSLINDSYSADLNSLGIALDFLLQQHQHSRRTVILSDILQSGMDEKELYSEVATALRERRIQRLIGIGEKITDNREAFENAGLLEKDFFRSVELFRKQFPFLQFRNEAILVKGARIFLFEEISRLLELQVHQTVLEINLNSLVYNLNQFRKQLKPSTKIMAMVKAFSYGGGSYEIANVLEFHKVDYLAVAYVDEGVELRKGGIKLPVMVMNTDEEAFETLVQYQLEPELYSPYILHQFVNFLHNNGISEYPIHLEIETGMNRLGFSLQQLDEVLPALCKETLLVKTVFTHLVASEDPSFDDFTLVQAGKFTEACNLLTRKLTYPFIRHINNSSGTMRHPMLQFDMVRLGIGLYGTAVKGISLQEVSVLRSTIAQVKKLAAGETVGYGRSGTVRNATVIATVRIGYADGYPRTLGNGKGKMWIRGKLAPTIGNICMDMTMIDVTAIDGINEGDEVTVFGGPLPVLQVAEWASTIPYEILTGISQRVQRVYYVE